MKKLILLLFLVFALAPKGYAMEFTAPEVPKAAEDRMPENTTSFSDGFWELVQSSLLALRPDIKEACAASLGVIAAVMLVSMLGSFQEGSQSAANLVGCITVGGTLMLRTNSMIHLGSETVLLLSDYGETFISYYDICAGGQGRRYLLRSTLYLDNVF